MLCVLIFGRKFLNLSAGIVIAFFQLSLKNLWQEHLGHRKSFTGILYVSNFPYIVIELVLQVYSIRDAAATNLKRLAEEFGPEWAMQHIVPQVCPQNRSYTVECEDKLYLFSPSKTNQDISWDINFFCHRGPKFSLEILDE